VGGYCLKQPVLDVLLDSKSIEDIKNLTQSCRNTIILVGNYLPPT
jgi:hypothetical protein